MKSWGPSNHVWRHLQFHWQLMSLADSLWKNEYLNWYLLLVIMRNFNSSLFLILVSEGVSISFFSTFVILFIILYSIANLKSFLLFSRIVQPTSRWIPVTLCYAVATTIEWILILMACFHVISIFLISGGDHPCAHYCLWRSLSYALRFCSMTHYDNL